MTFHIREVVGPGIAFLILGRDLLNFYKHGLEGMFILLQRIICPHGMSHLVELAAATVQ